MIVLGFRWSLLAFHPPRHLAGMQALLDHSLQNYGPLPSELRPRRMRSRTQSRPSPYPKSHDRPSITKIAISPSPQVRRTPVPVLQQIPVNQNINMMMSTPSSLETLKPFSPLVVQPKHENALGSAPASRPRIGSIARRTTLGSTKLSTGKLSMDQKENAVGQGSIMTYVCFRRLELCFAKRILSTGQQRILDLIDLDIVVVRPMLRSSGSFGFERHFFFGAT